MGTSLLFLIIIGALVMLWLDGARARETAVAIAHRMCTKRGFQLLDNSVYLQRTGLSWGKQGIRIRRMFDFDFSTEGTARRSGYIILNGPHLEQADLGLPKQPGEEGELLEPIEVIREPKKKTEPSDKVVSINRPKKK